MPHPSTLSGLKRFDRDFFSPSCPLTWIGEGELGGKARGLAEIQSTLQGQFPEGCEGISVAIPYLTALTTEAFDDFMELNELWETALDDLPDDRMAHAFLKGELPMGLVGDLRALVEQVQIPLAVRSSSLLEDSLEKPFAGVYATKMIPNHALDADTRFRKLVDAVKLVYASTFFRAAKSYRESVGVSDQDEKMAVLIQEIVGLRHGDRFYPNLSGVGRSYNYYPSGHARPEEGYAQLALGLGKTIVDGSPCWGYSPAYPKNPPPYNNIGELLKQTQTTFWAVNFAPVPFDPGAETEYLIQCELPLAEADDTLRFVASTYDPSSNRIVPNIAARGPRLLNFAPLLQYQQIKVNPLIQKLLRVCQDAVGAPVEIEFALCFDPTAPPRCGFLQVRPMAVNDQPVDIHPEELQSGRILVAADRVLGNGELNQIQDVIYLRPETFDPMITREMAREVAELNRRLVKERRPYLLIGFGRWGTSDPTGGIPVDFGQISGVKVIVETQLPAMRADLSQGSHFFHNLTSLRVLYFSVAERSAHPVDFAWLDAQPALQETAHVRHLRLAAPLQVKVDGRSGQGLILR